MRILFSAKSVRRRTVGVRILGKELQASEMLVPDSKCGPQMSIFSSAGHNMRTYSKTVTQIFSIVNSSVINCVRVGEGAYMNSLAG